MDMSKYAVAIRHVLMPPRIAARPVSITGFPVPWFAAYVDGVPDLRVADMAKMARAHRQHLCWVCGEKLGNVFAFLLGPMCIINRTISEPPSHRDCAVYSALACPFLSKPRMRRNEKDLPEGFTDPEGMVKRNPGAVAVWITRGYRPFRSPDGGTLFTFDDPEEVLWFAEGREATHDEVATSIHSGLPILREEARKEGPKALAALSRMIYDATRYLPKTESLGAVPMLVIG